MIGRPPPTWSNSRPIICDLAPRAAHAAEFTVLAFLVHQPGHTAGILDRLSPLDFTTPFSRQVARICLAGLKSIGMVDENTLLQHLRNAEVWVDEELDLYRGTLADIAWWFGWRPVLLGAFAEVKQ